MGNTESHSGGHGYYGDGQRHLSRKHMSRSLRLSSKQTYCSRRTPSGKPEHRNSETSTRSSSTPSIPQSLADHGLEPFNDSDMLPNFSGPIWVDRVAMNLRPMSFHNHPAHSPAATAKQATQDDTEPPEDTTLVQRTRDSSQEASSFKKKRSKSADMWREDSLEVSLSDLSQEHLTSTEEIGDTPDDCETCLQSSAQELLDSNRANSLDELYGPKSPACRPTHGRYAKWHKGGGTSREGDEDKMISPCEDDGAAYSAYTLPCRRSHCLSEGPTNHQGVMQGRRAQTIQDVTAGDGSDYEDSGIDGLTGDSEASQHHARRYKTMSVSFSAYSTSAGAAFAGSDSGSMIKLLFHVQDVTAGDGSDYEDSGIDGLTGDSEASQHHARRYKTMSVSFSAYSTSAGAAFAGSDSGSSSGAGAGPSDGTQGVYENFRQELEQNVSPVEVPEERSSAFSDEQSSVTLSSAYHTDPLLNVAAVQGTVRKAGRLAIKNFLVHKKNKKVELAPRRKWKSYWVSLKGCTLFFYETDGRSGIDHNSVPKHAVWAENSIVQAVPEHPKKDFVFCLSNSLGDSFLFQTCSQTELENWITAIHSACAAAVARQHHREDTVRLLRAEIRKLEQKIDMDEKMKKMGDMQLSAVTDAKKRKTILEQIFLWEQNLEQFHMDLIIPFTSFRFRCYLSSLQGGELPNPKRLLAFASRPTKLAMGRLGIFSVSSFHALVAARTESGVRRRTQAMSRSTSKRKSRFSSLWGLDTHSKRKSKGHPSINQVFAEGDDPVKNPLEGMFEGSSSDTTKDTKTPVKGLPRPSADHDIWSRDHLTPSWVLLPNDQPVLAIIQPGESALDMLETICKAHQLDPTKHYVRLKLLIENQVQFYIPKPEEDIYDLLYKEIELCCKIRKVIQFDRDESCMIGYGFSISVVEEDSVQQLYITDVKAGGLAFAKEEILDDGVGLIVETLGDSLDDDSKLFAEFDDYGKEILDDGVGLIVETSGDSLDDDSKLFAEFDDYGKLSVCSACQEEREKINEVVSHQNGRVNTELDEHRGGRWACVFLSEAVSAGPESVMSVLKRNRHSKRSSDSIYDLLHLSTEQVAAFCRSLHEMNPSSEVVSSSSGPESSSLPPSNATPRQLSDADKLRKVICELVETERTYVKDLNYLIGRYLTPLQKESFLTQDELDVLFGNLPEMLEFQVEFLKTLEDGTRLVPDLEKLERVEEFKKILFSLGGSFLYYADRFKIYSAFCASHTKVPKVLVKAKTDAAFKAFLDERNPKQQHSSTLESYLIKPIQRVLKYPLLLRELHSLTDPDSEEHYHLNIAMKAMNTVASHINEMQKIHEEFGAVFDLLISEHAGDKKEVADLSMGDLLLHTSVTWINPSSSLGKCKKEPQLATFVSAPTRTLGRRKLVRNRFTIDTDIVFDTEPDSDSPDSQHAQQQGIVPAGDTDRWVEEQFDLQRYEEQEQDVKETDILSDDDEFCQSALSPSTDPDVEGPLSALSLEGDTAEEEEEEEEDGKKDYKSQHAKLSHLGKQCAMSVASVDEQVPGEDIWVRRDSSTENETQDETQS
ncbi:T-lymphoma invasion and metastasis-inducing protein 1-like [Sinocyclocheilus rhinocerous]|uniref:T-lymphoma invasion and metastasis-inducing protein 1-like n=1 Tax=Sinocyclocheilus rhinocerous TaxID=307959 RepID=UPI0007B8AC23|nr:PREDICTED: T-lymphoma invasion and metastasis-inducing protein 1-like [Sinocyclocheilus rhinocerous]